MKTLVWLGLAAGLVLGALGCEDKQSPPSLKTNCCDAGKNEWTRSHRAIENLG